MKTRKSPQRDDGDLRAGYQNCGWARSGFDRDKTVHWLFDVSSDISRGHQIASDHIGLSESRLDFRALTMLDISIEPDIFVYILGNFSWGDC